MKTNTPNLDELLKQIKEASIIYVTEDLWETAKIIKTLKKINYPHFNGFLATLDPDMLFRRIDAAKNLKGMGWLINILRRNDYKQLYQILDKLDSTKLSEQICATNGLWLTISLIEALVKAGYKRLGELDPNALAIQLHTAKDPWNAAKLIWMLNEIDNNLLKQVLAKLDPNIIFERIYKTENWENIVLLINILKNIGYERLNELDPAVISQQIRTTKNLWNMIGLIEILENRGYKRFNELDANALFEQICTTEDLWTVANLIAVLKKINYKRLNEFDFGAFLNKIRTEHNAWHALKLIEELFL